jgi:hypothetical protein
MASKTYLNRYRIVTGLEGVPVELDRNPSGAVYRAEDIESGNPVALRVIDLKAVDHAATEQLERIAAALKQLRHINVPAVYGYAREGDRLICAAELLEGTAADAWVTAHGPMPLGTALRIASQVVGALAAATFHGLVHPAINPANLLLVPGQTPEGDWPLIKLLNFLDVSQLATDQTARRFASPEQLLGASVDFRSEIYSLGCTLSYLLTGDVPAGSGAFRARGVPKPVAALITHMLATDPEQRPQDLVAFQEQIRDCLAQTERREAIGRRFGLPAATTDTPVAHTARTPGVMLKPLALAAGLMLLAGIVALLMANGVFSRKDTMVGVPVGVPENTAVAQATPVRDRAPVDERQTTVAAAETTTAPTTTDAAPATDNTAPEVASNAPVLTSEPAEDDVLSRERAATASSQPTAVAMNEPEAASPAEGPTETSRRDDRSRAAESLAQQQRQSTPAPESEPPVVAQTETAPAAPARETSRETIRAAEPVEAPQPKPAATPVRVVKAPTPAPKKPAERIARREVRRAEPVDDVAVAALPPIPRGAKRARYVGTAPDGSLMFEMPSEERVYAAPPAAVAPRRRARRPAVDDLPVLPAEPVTEDDLLGGE